MKNIKRREKQTWDGGQNSNLPLGKKVREEAVYSLLKVEVTWEQNISTQSRPQVLGSHGNEMFWTHHRCQSPTSHSSSGWRCRPWQTWIWTPPEEQDQALNTFTLAHGIWDTPSFQRDFRLLPRWISGNTHPGLLTDVTTGHLLPFHPQFTGLRSEKENSSKIKIQGCFTVNI